MEAEAWQLVPFGELTENFDSRRAPVKEADRRLGPYPYYGASGIVDHVEGFLFDGEYLLIGEDGENLRTRQTPVAFLASGRFWVNNHAHIVRGNHRADTRFLKYALSNTDISGYLTGSTMPKLTQGNLNRVLVVAPPLEEQKAISDVLGALDDKIELNRRMNATLEAMARALFQSWFVDFDPVRAKMDGRVPSGMDAETAKLFPSEFETCETGKVPREWKRAPLGDWATPLSGGTPSKGDASLWSGNVPWISPKVMTSIHADEAEDFVSPSAIGNGTRLAPVGATLIMVRGMGLHQHVRVSEARGELAFNQDVKALVPKGIEATLLLYAMLNAQAELLGRVESSGHGTGKLPSEILLSHMITMPPLHIQKQLARTFVDLNDRIASGRTEVRTLSNLRDTLLPKLLSGELSLSSGHT